MIIYRKTVLHNTHPSWQCCSCIVISQLYRVVKKNKIDFHLSMKMSLLVTVLLTLNHTGAELCLTLEDSTEKIKIILIT